MTAEQELTLSFYKELSEIDDRPNVYLVKHIETDRVFVRKNLTSYSKEVYDFVLGNKPAGVPLLFECLEDEEAGHLIIIEEYINGVNLRDYLDSKDELDSEFIESVAKQLCEILGPFHENNPPIIHRDINPSNMMITDEGKIYLLDFDAGKLHAEGKGRDTELIGTKGYAAPEQYGFSQSDARTDIFAIGKTMEEMLEKCADPSLLRQKLIRISKKCTSMDPANRYGSAKELSLAIEEDPKNEKKKVRQKNVDDEVVRSWLPPGYRSKNPVFILASTIWYAFIIYVMFSDTAISDKDGRIDSVLLGSAMVISTFVVGNYKGVADKLPLLRSEKPILKIIGGILVIIIVFAITSLIAVTVEK